MAGLADTFQQVLDSLPDDWTDMELDLRIFDERRYIDAAVLLVTCNAQPYSEHDWHWRILVAHRFGHAAAPSAVRPSQYAMPRCGPETRFRSPVAKGSNTHRSAPDSASSAISRDDGVDKYSVPPTTRGVVSNAVGRRASRAVAESGRGSSSPV